MSDTPQVPRRVTLLGQALRPLWVRLATRLDAPAGSASGTPDMAQFLARHLEAMRGACMRLEDRTRGVTDDVLSNEAASDADVQHAASRLTAVVDELLDGQREVRASSVHGANAEARDLLAGAYRHLLVEIRDWLGEVVEALADPLAAARRRGLALDEPVELTLALRLTPAPQLAALARWARRQPGSTRLSLWETIGVLALGWGIGNALFGNHDDCC